MVSVVDPSPALLAKLHLSEMPFFVSNVCFHRLRGYYSMWEILAWPKVTNIFFQRFHSLSFYLTLRVHLCIMCESGKNLFGDAFGELVPLVQIPWTVYSGRYVKVSSALCLGQVTPTPVFWYWGGVGGGTLISPPCFPLF